MKKRDPNWWRGAVIYQVYPRSYYDCNGDGIGDLLGVCEKLPYIASLGVDAIWLSPFFPSPMKDFGYDVSDYCDIDPMFGSLADFDLLIARAHELGLKVMIDLVLSHSSDQHEWFKKSRQSRDNAKSDWYVWADPKPDGTAPNNWLSIFGGSAWTWDARREQYYLHNFLASQPDLNFHNDDVQNALLDIVRFWLERGVDGFRLDTINFYFCDKYLRDNPNLPKAQRNNHIAPSVNPYNHQLHIFDKNQPENIDFLKKFRDVLRPYNAAAVGEVGDAQRGLEIMGEYTSGDDKVHMCYPFEMLQPDRLTSGDLSGIFQKMASLPKDSWPCWSYSNHDVVRHVTRWNFSYLLSKTYSVLLMCLRGSVCLYQGEELALPEASIKYEDLQDPYGIEFWPEFKGRDGCRTPMVWSNVENGGFSAAKPWLPVPDIHLNLAVEEQEKDPLSMLNFYRQLIAFRKKYPVLRHGDSDQPVSQGTLFFFRRYLNNSHDKPENIYCVFNLGDKTAKHRLPSGHWQPIGHDLGAFVDVANKQEISLGPWQFCLMKNEETSNG